MDKRALIKRVSSDPLCINDGVKLRSFQLCLRLVCVDQSSGWKAGLSWSVFFLLAIGVPITSHYLFSCNNCDEKHRRPYDGVVQLSLSLLSTVAFLNLSQWFRTLGIRRFLFLDKLENENLAIRNGYEEQLQTSMKLLCIFVLPCFVLECTYRIWWYTSGSSEIPYFWNMYASDAVMCILQLCSWVYRIASFILVCIIYRLICSLQIMKLEEFAQVFQRESEVAQILKEHLNVKRNLRIISHRFRTFILPTLFLVTASQFVSLLLTTRSNAENNIFELGELALCSINLVTGLFICLRSATKITHKAHSLTSIAAKWHACATIDSSENVGDETECLSTDVNACPVNFGWALYDDDDGEDDNDSSRMMPIFANTISFQKRQALVTYLQHNRAGMTVYGFMMDRSWLHAIFGVEMALLLWLLNKTIGV